MVKIIYLDYEGEMISNINEAFCIIKYFIDTSFDGRGVLNIQVHNKGDEITAYHSFIVPRIYNFVKKNKTYYVGLGKITLDDTYVESFKNFNVNEFHYVFTLLEISESLDNFYHFKQKKEDFLK